MSADKLKGIAGRAFPEADHRAARCYAAAREAYDLSSAERDKEWAAALSPKNVGTDYGAFLADPRRAALLIEERVKLAEDEGRAEERKALRARIVALSLSHWPNDVRPYRDDILAALDARAKDPSPGNAASRNISDGVPGVAPESPAVDWMKRMEKR